MQKWRPTNFFCAWRDQTFLRLARTMQKLTPTEVFSRLVRPNVFLTGTAEAQVSADRIFFARGAIEHFNDWRER